MILSSETYRHPTQASRVALKVFEESGPRYLVTESRSGPQTVVSTLGVFAQREEALARAQSRASDLTAQRYERVAG